MTQIQLKNVTDQILANIKIHTKLIQDSGELVILLQEFGLSFPGYNPVELLQLEDRCRHFIDFVDFSSKANTSKANTSKAHISAIDQSTQCPKPLLSQELCVIVKCMIYHINVTVTYTKDCITILTSRKGEDVYVTYRLDFNYRSALNYSAFDIRDFILEKVKGYSSSVDDLLPPDFEGFGFFKNDSPGVDSGTDPHTGNACSSMQSSVQVQEKVSFGPKFIEKWNAARDPTDPAGWSSLRHLRNNETYVNSVRGAQPEHPKSEWFQVPGTN